MIDSEDIKVCNCAGCNEELLSRDYLFVRDSLPYPYHNMAVVGGRVQGRPYCGLCLNTRRWGRSGGQRRGRLPAEENLRLDGAIRYLEGD